MCNSPISTSPSVGKVCKSSPDSTPDTSRSGPGTANDIPSTKELRRGESRSHSVEATAVVPGRSSSVDLNKATSDCSPPISAADRAVPGEPSASQSRREDRASQSPSSTASATHSTDVASRRSVNLERGGPGVVSPDSSCNATLTTTSDESPAYTDGCRHRTTALPSISVDSDVGESALEAPASVSPTGRSHGENADSHVHSPPTTRPAGELDGHKMTPLTVPQSVDAGFYSEQDRRRMAVLSGGWHREMHRPHVVVGTDYTSSTSHLLPGCVSMLPGQTMTSAGDATGHRAAMSDGTVVDLSAGSSRSRDKTVDLGRRSPRRGDKTGGSTSGASQDTNSTVDLKAGASRVGVAAPSSLPHQSVVCNKRAATNGGSSTNSSVTGSPGVDDVVDLSASSRTNHIDPSPGVDINTSMLNTETTTTSRTNHLQDAKEESPYREVKRSHQDTPPCAGRSYNLVFPCAGRSYNLVLPCAGRSYNLVFPCAGRSYNLVFPCAGRSYNLVFPCAGR